MFRVMLLASGAFFLGSCSSIQVPYFQSLKPADVCGAVPKKCQPTSSEKWVAVDSLDYRQASAILGRKYSSSIFETSVCGTQVGDRDVVVAGESSLSGTLKKNGRSGFSAKASASLDDTLRSAIGGLPDDVEAAAKAELTNTVTKSANSAISLNYFRADLTTAYIDSNLAACLATMSKGDRVVTGVSVLETSGEWSRTRVGEFVAAFESSASYNSLSAEAKADWNNKKDLALNGTFKPIRYVFAAAYRKK